MEDISALEFANLSASDISQWLLIDVRENLEFQTLNIGGRNIPVGKLQSAIDEEDFVEDKNRVILVICQRGIRSRTAKTILEQNGYKNVRNLLGGLVKLNQIQHL